MNSMDTSQKILISQKMNEIQTKEKLLKTQSVCTSRTYDVRT